MSSDTAGSERSPLDLFSISQKICIYGAPFLAIIPEGKCSIIQTCCNHWDCPRCGEMRAKHEYGRIVTGAKDLSQSHTLYFYTFTCRGKDMPLDEAQRNYLLWTNRLLSTMRARCTKESGHWCYVQVTERQKRGHPHSHLLMAWIPKDVQQSFDAKGSQCLFSEWFNKAHNRAGLGTQSQITEVVSAEATARYIAKYLFKDAMFTTMPKNWHRVRYSQSFPKAVEKEKTENVEYIPLLCKADWQQISKKDYHFEIADKSLYDYAIRRVHNVDYKPVQAL